MLHRAVILFTLVILARAQEEDSESSSSSSRYYPWYRHPYYYPSLGAFAGDGFAFAGFPFYHPYPFSPFFPFHPGFYPPWGITPWYKGPNVCKEKKVFEESKVNHEYDEFLKDVPESRGSYAGSSTRCWGDEKKYACVERKTTNGTTQVIATKYQCCHGYVPSPNGCVESPKGKEAESDSTSNPGTRVRLQESSQYHYVGYP